ncbi:4-hydroxy-2-oxovalerate aldolase [Baekduia alba]|uniref:4-hydroxy-2-oxovalerate aldolase n=1 Tax=Baekduia alba TaxID=2997333 RepID=UPI0023423DD8|nr:4-hydroxy-2-oxovalerate aldolase [Baekduia alba]WCB95255.1 4-hydroxy-2-oxovalerate aldolase [Baekduia alba]
MSPRLCDSSLRDGMHSVGHRFTVDEAAAVARGLDAAAVDVIEVGHGDGLGGSSIQYGHAATADAALVEAVVAAAPSTDVAVLLLPGIGTLADLRRAQQLGARVARVATHCTEADIAAQHLSWAAENGMTPVGFLMMSHMLEPAALAEQARLMERCGAACVYVVDSAGALLPRGIRERVAALGDTIGCDVGIHTHNNLGCAVANVIAGVASGATWVDGSLCGLGAGAGNAATEVLAVALERAEMAIGADPFTLMDVAEEVVRPLMDRPPAIDRDGLTIGYAGVYSSFLLHARRAGEKYGVDPRDILLELGRRRVVGGQEDMIIDVAAQLADGGA